MPKDVKEAARAFGATEWQVLRGVELPLARPSILAGINQTILMCLSMVVIASLIGAGLIGAQGLGSVVLQSLQYAAKRQWLLAGLAILLCAMVIDRIVQGSFRERRLTGDRDKGVSLYKIKGSVPNTYKAVFASGD